MPLFSYFTRRADRRKDELHVSGYNYAAGELLRGVEPEQLEYQIDAARAIGDFNSFDRGMIEAMRAWRVVQAVKGLKA